MVTERTRRWCLQGRRKGIRSPQHPRSEQRRDAAQRMTTAGMRVGMAGNSKTQHPLRPFPFLQRPEVCGGKNKHPSPGHHFICFAGGETEAAAWFTRVRAAPRDEPWPRGAKGCCYQLPESKQLPGCSFPLSFLPSILGQQLLCRSRWLAVAPGRSCLGPGLGTFVSPQLHR